MDIIVFATGQEGALARPVLSASIVFRVALAKIIHDPSRHRIDSLAERIAIWGRANIADSLALSGGGLQGNLAMPGFMLSERGDVSVPNLEAGHGQIALE